MEKRSSTFLMANLGSEVTRLLLAREEKKEELIRGAYERSLRILDELESLEDMATRLDELKILRKVIDNLLTEDPEIKVSPTNLKEYFMPFALRALSEDKII